MELIRILRTLRMSDKWVIAHGERAFAILINAVFILCTVVLVEFWCNTINYRGISIALGIIGFIGIAVNAMHPGIVVRIFEFGTAAGGIPDPTRTAWEGGTAFLKTYARGIHLILFYFTFISFILGIISFAKYPTLFWVLLLGIMIMAMWPKEIT